MDHKTKSTLTLIVLIGFMTVIAFFTNNLQSKITGTVVKPVCKCTNNIDCNDQDPCTEDICLYADSCEAAICINKLKEECQ